MNKVDVVDTCKLAISIASWPICPPALKEATRSSTLKVMISLSFVSVSEPNVVSLGKKVKGE